jgi:hypothetical protein
MVWPAQPATPFIDPLPVPAPITIARLATERVTAEAVDITPLQFETVQIHALEIRR